MKDSKLMVTFIDQNRLLIMIDAYEKQTFVDSGFIRDFKRDLKRAHALTPERMPKNVVTMNSRFRLKNLVTGEEKIVTLAFPNDVKHGHNSISILSPLGAVLLGRAAGDIIEYPLKARVEEILYQPESSGDYIHKGYCTVST